MRGIDYHLFHKFKLLIVKKTMLIFAYKNMSLGYIKIESLMGNKPRNSLSSIMTKRQKMSFGNDVAQNCRFDVVW